jgi:hypothetical protein
MKVTLGDGWEDPEVNNDPKDNKALKMGKYYSLHF